MAAYLIRQRANRAAIAIGMGACLWSFQLSAQTLKDPTRPPFYLHHSGATHVQAETELQSVLVSPNRKVAIIQGRTVQVGDMVGDARVVAIAETQVTLREAGGERILRLYPQGGKMSAANALDKRTNSNK